MREIKFREWDADNHCMVYDWYKVVSQKPYSENRFLGIQKQTLATEVMQYTGLKDKNGKEIYEGDIITTEIKYLDHLKQYIIGFRNGTFCFLENDEEVQVWDDGINKWHSLENIYSIRVVGNIYENPEILK